MFIIKVLATFAIVFFLTFAAVECVDAYQNTLRSRLAGKEYIVKQMRLEKVKEWLYALAGAELVICLLVVLVGIWV